MLCQDYSPVFITKDIKDETIIQAHLTGSNYALPKSFRSEADAEGAEHFGTLMLFETCSFYNTTGKYI